MIRFIVSPSSDGIQPSSGVCFPPPGDKECCLGISSRRWGCLFEGRVVAVVFLFLFWSCDLRETSGVWDDMIKCNSGRRRAAGAPLPLVPMKLDPLYFFMVDQPSLRGIRRVSHWISTPLPVLFEFTGYFVLVVHILLVSCSFFFFFFF
ncbi:hypothetical protein M413DRAFT_323010 [Hebeloma cylindrosporum]|uniref:Uncharacterized protein n=1 Tax=Hebeloma cylindrosporum TaxID=76867 RepID=A0A0C3BV82_HEBCY|nr:hypothetical protein M413DRAFT_323010 [Hebeloma cylindrosporum h7]